MVRPLAVLGAAIVAVIVAVIFVLGLANHSHPFIGEKVEIGPATVGKVMTQSGYREGIIETSRFRLDRCLFQLTCSDQWPLT